MGNDILSEGYGIMPNMVLYSKELTDKQKLLYCLISSLCAEKGYCRASNKFLGEKLDVKEWTISTGIKKLIECGFIDSEIDKNKGNERHITIGIVKNHMTYCEKSQEGYCEKSQEGGIGKQEIQTKENPQKMMPNITINNITTNIYSAYYGKRKGIDEKACNKLINAKLEQGITLDDIKNAMVLYNSECRVKQEWRYVKKFETRIKEFQPLDDEGITEQLRVIARLYKDKVNSDPNFQNSKIAKETWDELTKAFGEQRIREIWKSEGRKQINLITH